MKLASSIVLCLLFMISHAACQEAPASGGDLRAQAAETMRKAAIFYRTRVASHGGYVYYYTPDLRQRWGEGRARPDQIWVQPPGTPTVGMAYLRAYEATGGTYYLDAAREAALALVAGQLSSGGWSNQIDLSLRRLLERLGRGGEIYSPMSSLDDGQTQSAIKFLARIDRVLGFQHEKIHKSVLRALESLLAAQFPNGAFPQGYRGPVRPQPVLRASYPEYDWRTEGRMKEYWFLYTLNDNVIGYVADAFAEAYSVYGDERYKTAIRRIGDFLILAQMPEPQPAWAQQYSFEMKPVWARRFEPPAISGHESQEVLKTLLLVYRVTGDRKYLEPIPRAVAYLRRSLLSDGRLARFYELRTNKPLFMTRSRRAYTLTYDDSNTPGHYGWKFESRLDEIEREYNELAGLSLSALSNVPERPLEDRVREAIASLDDHGRWISVHDGTRIVGQPGWQRQAGFRHISSAVFSRNIETLSEYLIATADQGR